MIESDRLILRRWREADGEPLARIHADPHVMCWLGRNPMTRLESDDYLLRFEEHVDRHGFGFWAIERRGDGALVGLAGLQQVDRADHPRVPCVEIAWRLARTMWGQGYASEAATAALADGFGRIGLEEVLAWTAAQNVRSQAVMQRIGMIHEETSDFEVAALPEGHPLRAHVLFSITRENFAGLQRTA